MPPPKKETRKGLLTMIMTVCPLSRRPRRHVSFADKCDLQSPSRTLAKANWTFDFFDTSFGQGDAPADYSHSPEVEPADRLDIRVSGISDHLIAANEFPDTFVEAPVWRPPGRFELFV